MKKIVVMSDNHGNINAIDKIKELEADGDFYVHCGDSEATPDELEGWLVVRGNNDWYYPYDEEIVFEVEGVRFLVTHGHRYGYYNRKEAMVNDLKKHYCDVLLSGHTHVPQDEQEQGFYLINPGSTTLPRRGSEPMYCVIIVDNDQINVEFKKIF
ncbi:MAG: metallophosphoesterase family protein [Thomasclavelia sp.]